MSISTRFREHLRSNVWGIAALFVALTGTAWAGAQIGASDIDRDAIRSKHVKADALRGGDVDESTLGRVPSARVATEAETAATAANAAEAAHATTADDAAALGGVGPDEFLRSDRFETAVPKTTNSANPNGGLDCAIGTMTLFAGDFAPGSYMFAHGQVLNIGQNTQLYSVIGNQYGGNGTSTFALPDTYGLGPGGANWAICVTGIFPNHAYP